MRNGIFGIGLGALLSFSCSNTTPDGQAADEPSAGSGGAASGAPSAGGAPALGGNGGNGGNGGSTAGTAGSGLPGSGGSAGGAAGTGGAPTGGTGALAGSPAGGAPSGGSAGAGTAGLGGGGGEAAGAGAAGAGGIAAGGASGSAGSAAGGTGPSCPPATNLKDKYSCLFPIGAAVDSGSYMTHAALLTEHFSSITAENEMKFVSLQPNEGQFTYDAADRMVDFAQRNDMKVRGHALVWHTQNPSWLFSNGSGGNVSRETLLARMRSHISNVVRHFRGKVYVWDVVNEAVMEDGDYRSGSETDENKRSKWHEILGESYIAEAFRAAHEADPDAKLFYNDFYNYIPAKQQGIYEMLRGLLDQGVPVHGVGLQAHLNVEPSTDPNNQAYYQNVTNMEDAIELYKSLGLEVQVTELDMSLYIPGVTYTEDTFYTQSTFTDELKAKQAERYRAFFDLFRRHADVITSVTFWGIADDNTWLSEFSSGRKDFPLLFDNSHEKKPAFHAVMDF